MPGPVPVTVTSTTDAKTLGYGGSFEITINADSLPPVTTPPTPPYPDISSANLLVSSVGMTQDRPNPFMDIMHTPNTRVSRSKILVADGVELYTGSFTFDVTQSSLEIVKDLCKRGRRFSVTFWDGDKGRQLKNNHFSNLTLSGSIGGLLSASVSFTSAENWTSTAAPVSINFLRDSSNHQPYGYWYSGGPNVKEWSLAISQSVTPVYTNVASANPTYLRVGMWDMNLQVTAYEDFGSLEEIIIATKLFTVTGILNNSGYSFGGISELGAYTHSFLSGVFANSATSGFGTDGGGAVVFAIT